MTNTDRRVERAGRGVAVALGLLLLLGPALAGAREDAIALYDAGRYAEAQSLLESIDREGKADGQLLYRLYYCQNVAGDATARTTLRRAVEALAAEPEPDLISAFYLANAYRNSGRITDMRRVAQGAIDRVGSGKLDEPTTALSMFRLGKLHADVDDIEQAAVWYARALEHDETAALPGPYATWSSRFLADRAYRAGQLAEADRYLGRLLELEQATIEDLDRLGTVRVRLGKYREASDAWKKAERLDPAEADRARYCGGLARLAAGIGVLPATAPDDRPWSELSQQELETLLRETATAAREKIAAVEAGEPLDPAAKSKINVELADAKARFVAAGLEYALRPFDIRAAAFSGGYAPMVFHARRWRLPR